MNRILGFNAPLSGDHLAQSALPHAPVVIEPERAPRTHNRAAATLRALARSTDRLANRLDPTCA